MYVRIRVDGCQNNQGIVSLELVELTYFKLIPVPLPALHVDLGS